MPEAVYTSDEYLKHNPDWHTEDSPWKAGKVLEMMRRHNLTPRTICEVGCGAGEILRQVQMKVDPSVTLRGYEIAPLAIELCKQRANERLSFHLGQPTDDPQRPARYDLALIMDVIEHLEDYYSFLRMVRTAAEALIIHIPLDMSVNHVARAKPLTDMRKVVGHIHSFSKETALAVLLETGFTVVDHFYTPWFAEVEGGSWRRKIAKVPRLAWYKMNPDLAVRFMGGASLMVYAKS